MKNYRAVIIGAGNIGCFFDSPDSSSILTHAHAFSQLPNVELVGISDIALDKAEKAVEIWGGEAFSDAKEMLETVNPDIISICSPNHVHYDHLVLASQYSPKIVLHEKPFTTKLEDSADVIKKFSDKNIYCSVNYIRRYVSQFIELRDKIQNGEFGQFARGTAYYGKGLLHNGSHMIDFIQFLFGKINEHRLISNQVDDGISMSPTCHLKINDCSEIFLIGTDYRNFTMFELDLVFEKARVRLVDGCRTMEIYQAQSDPLFAGYTILSKKECIETDLKNGMMDFISKSIKSFESDSPPLCSVQDAYDTQRICEELVNSIGE